MELIRINVRGVEASVWDDFRELRADTRTATGKLISDAVRLLIADYYDDEDEVASMFVAHE